MNDSGLDIVHSVTIKRKPKNNLIPESVFHNDHHLESIIHLKENHPPNLLPWRIISSGVVARGTPVNPQQQPIDQPSFSANTTLPTLHLPKSYNWTEGLRTPMRGNKTKIASESHSTMTKNCEQLFSRMSNFNEKKPKVDVDPSQSVRRIIKGSGLLRSFGTGYLQEDDIRQSPITFSQPIAIETENENEPSEPSQQDYYQNLNTSQSSQEESSYFQLSSSPPMPVYFDTVVLQKTVETELVEYMPNENYPLFSDNSRSSSPIRKKGRFKNIFADDFFEF